MEGLLSACRAAVCLDNTQQSPADRRAARRGGLFLCGEGEGGGMYKLIVPAERKEG